MMILIIRLFFLSLVVLLAFISCVPDASNPVAAWNYSLHLRRDKRVAVVLGVFGHAEFGKTHLSATNLVLESDARVPFTAKVWLELRRVSTASVAKKLKKQIEKEEAECSEIENDEPTPLRHYLKYLKAQPREDDDDLRTALTFTVKEPGFYALVYARCISSKDTPKLRVVTSAAFRVSQWNPFYATSSGSILTGGGGNKGGGIDVGATFLSVGEAPLPTIYAGFGVLFAVGAFFWWRELSSSGKAPADSSTRQRTPPATRIHYAMLIVGILKTITLFLQSGVYAHRNKTGGTGDAVDIMFVLVAAVKTAILFVIVILLGTGWSISRASLSELERKMLLAVLVVQVGVNIALAVIEEGAPTGTETVASLRLGLRVADLVCACVILVPIIFRAKSQHDAAVQGGDKARIEARRLATFRSFYLATFIFLYFTRIVVPYLESHVSYLLMWVPALSYEIAALCFYYYSARLFHPSASSLSKDEEENEAMTTTATTTNEQVPLKISTANNDASKKQSPPPNASAVNPNELEELNLE